MGIGLAVHFRQFISFAVLICAGFAAMGAPAASESEPLQRKTILVVGDSLSAEYGLARGTGWVRLLADRVASKAPQYSVANASISGDTTSNGRTRLGPLLREHHPAIVVIELGANDGLRGLSVDAMRTNLQAMIDECHAAKARVLLVGNHLPPNYGAAFDARFFGVYNELAQRNHVGLAPFLLDGFGDQLDLFQADHIHPIARAEPRMLENVWPYLAPMLT
jgi:acyl-CoA thioesterase-1